ncbi:hypothetical protein T484DRAFT_3152766 [Baffinella frigidus]|nr:hypothetical protein T484DRAFT_3152766 [Cryptophyta sp. CCMP2293]
MVVGDDGRQVTIRFPRSRNRFSISCRHPTLVVGGDGVTLVQALAASGSGKDADKKEGKTPTKTTANKPPSRQSTRGGDVPGKKHVSVSSKRMFKKDVENLVDDDWAALSDLYAELEEEDIALGLSCKFTTFPTTQAALELELQGRFQEAIQVWETLLDLPNEVAEDAPDAELNIWNNGVVKARKRLMEWEDLEDFLKIIITDETTDIFDIWTARRDHMKTYLRCLIGMSAKPAEVSAFGLTICRPGIDPLIEILEGAWDNKEKKEAVKEHLLYEAAFAMVLHHTPDRSRASKLVKSALDRFLEDWGSSTDAGKIAKRRKLRSLQSFVELEEYLSIFPDSAKRAPLAAVLDKWGRRFPSSQILDSTDAWDFILHGRLALLVDLKRRSDAFSTPLSPQELTQISGSVRKIHLSLSTMARREGNLDVAENQLVEAQAASGDAVPAEWKAKCFRSRVKLVAAKLVRQRDTNCEGFADTIGQHLADLTKQATKDGYLQAAGSGGAASGLRALFGDLRQLKLAASAEGGGMTPGEYQKEFECALEDYGAAAVHGAESGGGGVGVRKQGRMHMKMALFCDAELRRTESKAERSGPAAAGAAKEKQCAEIVVEQVLSALQCGSVQAQEHFIRCLELASSSPEARAVLVRRTADVPLRTAVAWLPQLLSALSRSEVDASPFLPLIERVRHSFPQVKPFNSKP